MERETAVTPLPAVLVSVLVFPARGMPGPGRVLGTEGESR